MVDTTGTFVRRMNRRANNFDKNAEKLRRDVAEEMLIEVVLATPVDKGDARSNWQVGVNNVPQGILPAYAPGRHLGVGESANANAAIATGMSNLSGAKLDDTLYLVNNVPYIIRLNSGYSEQAPVNFIPKAFDRARKRVQRARRLLER